MAIFGLHYARVPAALTRLATVHFGITLVGNLIFPVGIAMAILGQTPAFAAIGDALLTLSMAIFAYTV